MADGEGEAVSGEAVGGEARGERDLVALVRRLEQAVALVTEVIDPVRSDRPVAALPDDDVREALRVVESVVSRVSAAAAVIVAEWDRRRVWRLDGHRGAASALSSLTGLSTTSARRDLKRGRAVHSMPLSVGAVLDGRLTVDHLDLLARADQPWRHDTFTEHEPLLVGEMQTLRWVESTRLLDYWIQRVDADASADDARLRGLAEHCSVSALLDGLVHVDAVLAPIGAEIVRNELDRLEQLEHLKDRGADERRTPGQRRAAALVEMARRSASLSDGALRARPLFTVLVGDRSARHLCQLASGQVVHPSELLPHVDAAVMESVLFDGPHTVVGVSPRRTFTGVLRRAILARDKFCTHPSGCDVPADRCDIDHIVPWAHGGPTRQENGRVRCSTHNRHPDLVGPPEQPAPFRHVRHADLERLRHRWRTEHGLAPPGDAA